MTPETERQLTTTLFLKKKKKAAFGSISNQRLQRKFDFCLGSYF
jgi:hypothetical protein